MNTIEKLFNWVKGKLKRPVPRPPQSKVSGAVDPPVAQYHYKPKQQPPKSDTG